MTKTDFRTSTIPTWRAADAHHGSWAIGMLGVEERKLLFHLARDIVDGSGAVVDLGAFCGASAACLCEGLAQNPRAAHVPVHSYDLFIADDDYLVDFIRTYFGTQIERDGSFEPIFRQATSAHAARLRVHAGDIASETWPARDPIEILFVDAAKTLDLSGHIVRQFFPALMAGHSVIVQQDFYHPGTYYLVVLMDFLRPWCETIETRRDWSSAYRLARPIPPDALERAARYDFGYEEERAAIERTIEAMGEDGAYLQTSLAALVGRHQGKAAFDEVVARIRPPADLGEDDVIWPAQMQWARVFDPARIRRRTNWTG